MDAHAAYLAIYTAEYDRLRSYLRQRATPDTADDVAQEAFTRLWARWADIEDINRAAWTWEVARNLLIDTYRREARAVHWTWCRRRMTTGASEIGRAHV